MGLFAPYITPGPLPPASPPTTSCPHFSLLAVSGRLSHPRLISHSLDLLFPRASWTVGTLSNPRRDRCCSIHGIEPPVFLLNIAPTWHLFQKVWAFLNISTKCCSHQLGKIAAFIVIQVLLAFIGWSLPCSSHAWHLCAPFVDIFRSLLPTFSKLCDLTFNV